MSKRKVPPQNPTKADKDKSQKIDQCQTPHCALDPLLEFIPKAFPIRTGCKPIIWEPAAGDGQIVDKLSKVEGYNVVYSDLLTGCNFFYNQPQHYDIIITNPPYSIKYEWLERCYQLGKPFALLMPTNMLGTASGARLFKRYGIEVIFVTPRINFKMPDKGYDGSGAQFSTSWFTWGFGIGKQMTFETVVKYDDWKKPVSMWDGPPPLPGNRRQFLGSPTVSQNGHNKQLTYNQSVMQF
ncbi:MAG: hypothetical protein GY928_33655 [Colwellia sp.]|nr:hypothetical protein [Colwellia sp.]